MSSLQDVYSELQNNLEFRNQFKENPEAALKAFELELNQTDLEKILRNKKKIFEELDKRINK